jgi:hypothetical protein
MQFQKIPPTFVGFKNLIYSNGYNDQEMFASAQKGVQNVFTLMGVKSNMLSNFNISLAVFVVMPAIVGLTGVLINKLTHKPVNT